MIDSENWYSEEFFFEHAATSYKVSKVLHSEKSKWQQIDVLDTKAVGRLLLLDGKTMVSDKDEFVYHEIMAHVPMMVAPAPKNVLIIGGGDGGVVREFTKHPELKRIDLVEIDERVIEVSKEFFPNCTSGLTDKRVNILPMDGIQYIKDHKNEYDIIIIDSTDPKDFAEGLFTKDFYASVNDALTENGIMMAQTENPFYDEYGIGKIYENLKNAFPIVQAIYAPMIIYPGVFWTFAFASKTRRIENFNADKMNFMENLEKDLKWYNRDWHQGAIKLPNFVKNVLGIDNRN